MSGAVPEFIPVRRVVTGQDADGVSKVVWDSTITALKRDTRHHLAPIWNTAETPADIAFREGGIEDRSLLPHVAQPPPNGTRFVVIDYPPGNVGATHRTQTIDYVIVISGSIDVVIDDSVVTLEAGDVMVQRGTNHAWVNRGIKSARLALVLIDAQPSME